MTRNIKKYLRAAELAVGTGLYLLDHSDDVRRKVGKMVGEQVDDLRDRTGDLRDRAKDAYAAMRDRATDIADDYRDSNGSQAGWNVLRFMVGLGIGVGVGLLFAPANGEQTRATLVEKAQEFSGNVRQRFNPSDLRPTGTGD